MSASINQFGLHTIEYAIRKKHLEDPLHIAAHPEEFPEPGPLKLRWKILQSKFDRPFQLTRNTLTTHRTIVVPRHRRWHVHRSILPMPISWQRTFGPNLEKNPHRCTSHVNRNGFSIRNYGTRSNWIRRSFPMAVISIRKRNRNGKTCQPAHPQSPKNSNANDFQSFLVQWPSKFSSSSSFFRSPAF